MEENLHISKEEATNALITFLGENKLKEIYMEIENYE